MTLLDPASLVHVVAETDPLRLAVTTPTERCSYGELAARVDAAAARWRASGAAAGSLVRLVVPATVEGIARLLGVHACGAVPFPVAGDESIEETDLDAMVAVATSGTGGAPRVVALTVENVAASVTASQARLDTGIDDRWLLCLPLHHVGGLSILWRSFAAGGSVVALDGFDTAAAAAALREEATVASLVPTMAHRLLATGGRFDRVRFALLGGAPSSGRLVETALEAGLPLLQTYGMTETASQVATVAPGHIVDSLGTVGMPLDGIEIGFAGGEIVVDGPQVFAGYVGSPPRRGPHSTGDLGRLDEAGRLEVLGRSDDVVISGGEKIHPGRVEAALESHPAVTASVVFGVADPEWGQRLEAIVEGDAPPATLRTWLSHRLPRHEVPKHIVIVDELPRLSSGKPDREAIRRQAFRDG